MIVARYEGPKGGPGMPQLDALNSNLMVRQDMTGYVLFTNGRFSGVSQGSCICHAIPEAYVGGPIAIVQEIDIIKIDIPNKSLNIDLSEE